MKDQAKTMLEKYLQMFGKLRTDRGRDRYPEATYHRAPHKPLRLLSIIDLIARRRIAENLIEPSYEFVDRDEVLVSKRVQVEQNLPGHILTLRDRHIFTPVERQYCPAQENFDYHRTRRFLR